MHYFLWQEIHSSYSNANLVIQVSQVKNKVNIYQVHIPSSSSNIYQTLVVTVTIRKLLLLHSHYLYTQINLAPIRDLQMSQSSTDIDGSSGCSADFSLQTRDIIWLQNGVRKLSFSLQYASIFGLTARSLAITCRHVWQTASVAIVASRGAGSALFTFSCTYLFVCSTNKINYRIINETIEIVH